LSKKKEEEEKEKIVPEIVIKRLISQVRIPPRDLMLFAILRIFPRRSLGLAFLGVEDDERFLFVGVPIGLVLDDEGFEIVVVSSFLRLGSDDVGSKSMIEEKDE
jgi:hypothetical protein